MRRPTPLPASAARAGAVRTPRGLPGFLAGFLVPTCLLAPAEARRLPEPGTPPEVAAFVERRAACRRWDEADGTEPERAAETARERFRLKCTTLASDERRLRARYATSPDALEALGEAGDD